MENKKKSPTWANVVGILGIIFGALGLLGSTYELMMPLMFDMQEQSDKSDYKVTDDTGRL